MDGKQENINQLELLFKISNDVSSIMSDMKNFQNNYNTDKQNITEKIEDVRKDYEKEMKTMKESFDERIKQQDAQIKLLTTYTEALRTEKDKTDAKKWRTVVAFILTGFGGILLGCVPAFLRYLIHAGGN